MVSGLKPLRRQSHDVVLAASLRCILPVLRHLPFRAAVLLARGFGQLVFVLGTRDRHRAMDQLQEAMSPMSRDEARCLVRELFARLGEGVVAVLQLPRRDPGLRDSVRFKGLEHLEAALAKGRGAIWLTGHLGNWELLAAAVVSRGFPLRVITSSLRYPRLDRMLTAFRSNHGVRTLVRGRDTDRETLARHLAGGELLGVLVDQNTRGRGEAIGFLGRPAWTSVGPALLAVETGAPVVVGFIERRRADCYEVRVSPPLQVPEQGTTETQAIALMKQFNRLAGEAIRADPASWPWFHERWKTLRIGEVVAGLWVVLLLIAGCVADDVPRVTTPVPPPGVYWTGVRIELWGESGDGASLRAASSRISGGEGREMEARDVSGRASSSEYLAALVAHLGDGPEGVKVSSLENASSRPLLEESVAGTVDAPTWPPGSIGSLGELGHSSGDWQSLVPTGEVAFRARWFRGDLDSGLTWLEGNVRLEWAQSRIQCERLELVFGREPWQLKWLEASGGVTVEADGLEGYAGRVRWVPSEQRVSFEDHPTFRGLLGRLTGTRVVVGLEDGQLQCDECEVQWAPAGQE